MLTIYNKVLQIKNLVLQDS